MDKYVCVIGGINIDIKGIADSQIQPGESNEGHIYISTGGVARNIAENLARLEIPVYLLGCTGTDYFGDFIIEETSKAGVNTDPIIRSDEVLSSKYLSVTGNDGNMIYGLNDMKDSLKNITIEYVDHNLQLLKESCFIIADTNLSSPILNKVVSIGNQFSIPVFIDTVSVSKSSAINELNGIVEYLSLNENEFENVFGKSESHGLSVSKSFYENVSDKFKYVILRRGYKGVDFIDVCRKSMLHCMALNTITIESNGAGDAFNAGFIFAKLNSFGNLEALQMGSCAASFALSSHKSCSDTLTPDELLKLHKSNKENNEF